MRAADVSERPRPAGVLCRHYPDCVGCGLIGTAYGAQLEAKRQRVIDALSAYPRLSGTAVPNPIGSPRLFGYRNQVGLVGLQEGNAGGEKRWIAKTRSNPIWRQTGQRQEPLCPPFVSEQGREG